MVGWVMNTRLASALALAVSTAACADDGSGDVDAEAAEVGDARAAIVGGDVEPGRPAVVAIVHRDAPQQLICSGVLITSSIVVTAAHCLHPHVTGAPADELAVVFGESLTAEETRIDVTDGAYHPAWKLDDPESANDIGAVRLAIPAPVDPIALGPGPSTGEEVVLVGYGDTGRTISSSGVKRSGEAVVAAIGESWFRMDRDEEHPTATTCSGDSGGATLAVSGGVEVLIGVHSRGDCATAVWNERVDVHASGFLKSFLGEFGGCMEDGACALGCPSPDPDCPCAADDVCNAACGDADPDCDGEDAPCDEADESCPCAGGDCQSAEAPPPSRGWGSSGCAIGGGPDGGAVMASLAAIALAAAGRRRSGAARRGR